MERRAKYDFINNVLINKPSGNRPRGRPQQRWMDSVKKDLIRIGKTAVIEDIDDINHWRVLVETAKYFRV